MDKESLSALLDGELDELATARLLSALDDDGEVLTAWEHYGLIGDALRERDGPGQAGCAGARRAMTQIMAEAAPLQPRRALPWRPMMPWAVAASAALFAFLVSGPSLAPAIATAGGGLQQKFASLLGREETLGMQSLGEGTDPMARYIDFHREVAAPGFERTAFVGAGDGSGRGQ